jgi:hypothetical protein
MWFRTPLDIRTPGPARPGARRRQPPPAPRLRLEALEDRSVPSFSGVADYPAGLNPWAVATADFNGDGQLDLATATTR